MSLKYYRPTFKRNRQINEIVRFRMFTWKQIPNISKGSFPYRKAISQFKSITREGSFLTLNTHLSFSSISYQLGFLKVNQTEEFFRLLRPYERIQYFVRLCKVMKMRHMIDGHIYFIYFIQRNFWNSCIHKKPFQ